jgi:hypothetical protein
MSKVLAAAMAPPQECRLIVAGSHAASAVEDDDAVVEDVCGPVTPQVFIKDKYLF